MASVAPQAANVPGIRPEWAFLVLALAAGLFMVFVTPPFQSPDEDVHFFRAFQLSEGKVIAQREGQMVGGSLPISLKIATAPFERMQFQPLEKASSKDLTTLRQQPLALQSRAFFEFKQTALYTPVAYLPAVVGIWIGRLCSLAPVELLYASRLAALLCWATIVFVAIRSIPVLKWVMMLVGLLPMGVFTASTLSADVMTNALAMLFAAVILRSSLAADGPLRWKDGLTIILLCVLVAATKQVYFPIVAMTLMIPKTRFAGLRTKLLFCAGAVGVAVVTNLAWAWLVRGVITTEAWADPQKQTQFILAHPWEYVRVLGNTLEVWWRKYYEWYIGVLGWLDCWLPAWVYPSYAVMILAVPLLDRGQGRTITIKERLLLAGVVVVTLLLIATSLYITYTIPMDATIRGVQGRYFIPLTIPALMLLYNRKVKVPERWLGYTVMAFCTVVIVAMCLAILNRYYGINPLHLILKVNIMA